MRPVQHQPIRLLCTLAPSSCSLSPSALTGELADRRSFHEGGAKTATHDRQQAYPPHEQKKVKGGPEPVVAEHLPQGEQSADKDRERYEHHVAHVARPIGAAEDPVHLEDQHAARCRKSRPRKIDNRLRTHVPCTCYDADELFAERPRRGRLRTPQAKIPSPKSA